MLHINIAYFCIFLKKTRHITWIYILATLHVSACIAYKSMYMYISQILHIMFVCLQRFSVCFVCKQSKLRKMSNLTRTQEAWLLLQIHWLIFLGSAWSSGPAATSCPNISRTFHTRHAHAQGNVHWWRALLRVLQESVHDNFMWEQMNLTYQAKYVAEKPGELLAIWSERQGRLRVRYPKCYRNVCALLIENSFNWRSCRDIPNLRECAYHLF